MTVFGNWIQSVELRVGTNREALVTRNEFESYVGNSETIRFLILSTQFAFIEVSDCVFQFKNKLPVIGAEASGMASDKTVGRWDAAQLQLIAFPTNGLCS